MKTRLFITNVLILHAFVGVRSNDEKDENAGRIYMQNLNKIKAEQKNKATLTPNITDETLQLQLNESADLARPAKVPWKELIAYPWETYTIADLRRDFQKSSAVLSDEKFDKLKKAVSEMASIYSKDKICDYKDSTECDPSLKPDPENILMHADNALYSVY